MTAPAVEFAPELLLKAQGGRFGVRAAVFDVDGVLTDGRLFISEQGEVFKAFHVHDGQGLKLLQRAGIEPLLITGRDSSAVRRRVADLGLRHAVFGATDKLAAAQALLEQLGLDWATIAVIGDDWPDLGLMQRASFACAPADAHAQARVAAHYVTMASSGRGAAREFCDLLLCASGRYRELLAAQLGSLDRV